MNESAKEYPRTLEAVEAAEFSKWPIVDALLDEVEKTAGGSAKNGEYERVAKYLAASGYRSYAASRIQQFFLIGLWLESCGQASQFRQKPFELVYEAKRKAKSDHAAALEILSEATSKRDIRPDRVAEVTPEQVAVAVRNDPRAAAAIARDDSASRAVTAAQVDEGVRRRTEGDTRERFKPDSALMSGPQPWRHLVASFNDLHKAWDIWNDDRSWGLLKMRKGEGGAEWYLGEIDEAINILKRMRDTGHAYLRNAEKKEVV